MKNEDIKQLTAVLTQLLNKLNEAETTDETPTPTPPKPKGRKPKAVKLPKLKALPQEDRFDPSISTAQPPEYMAEPKPTEKIPIRELLAANLRISSNPISKCPRCDNYLQDKAIEAKGGLLEAAYECPECNITYEYDKSGILVVKKVL